MVEVEVVPASPVRCILQRVLVVAARPRYLSSHEATSLFIVAIATRHRGVAVVASVDHAGNLNE